MARSPRGLAAANPAAALCLHVAANAVAGWAAGIATLLAARVVQVVAGCGGLVLGRAIVRDSTAAGQAGSRMVR